MTEPSRVVIGVDVGGTFTDVFWLDESSDNCGVIESSIDETRPIGGFPCGVRAARPGISNIATVVHGTTVGTNALLERKGAKAGLITTNGFRDVLEMRRRDRPRTWGLWGQF